MATSIGVNCTSQLAYLAVVRDGALIEADPERLELPGLEESEGMAVFIEDVAREILAIKPAALAILRAEQPPPGMRPNHSHIYDRAVLETLIHLAGVGAGVPVHMMSKHTVRSRLNLPREGKLDQYLDEVFPQPMGHYWKGGRGLAAMAALAENRA